MVDRDVDYGVVGLYKPFTVDNNHKITPSVRCPLPPHALLPYSLGLPPPPQAYLPQGASSPCPSAMVRRK